MALYNNTKILPKNFCCSFGGYAEAYFAKMTSWRDVLRQRQLDIDAADKEEFEANIKCITPPTESIDFAKDCEILEFSSPSTPADAVRLLRNDELQASDSLQDDCGCATSLVNETSTAFDISVENSSTDQRETASTDSDVTEVGHQPPPASADFTEELKSDNADGESFHSLDGVESDHISSSVTDSLSSHQQQMSKSLSAEQLLLTDTSPTSSLLNWTSDYSESNIADEVPQACAATTTHTELPLDIQSPEHKRTRRHAGRRDDRAKKKYIRTAGIVESVSAENVMNLQQEREVNNRYSEVLVVHPTLPTEQLEFSAFQTQPSDERQHSTVVSDVADTSVADDKATQVVRHLSYTEAIGTASKNSVTSQQQHERTLAAHSADIQASKDHSSAHESAKNGRKYFCFCTHFVSFAQTFSNVYCDHRFFCSVSVSNFSAVDNHFIPPCNTQTDVHSDLVCYK